MTDYTIKLSPTRDQRRELDKAARAAGQRNTGPWALSELLRVVRVGSGVQAASVASKPALAPIPVSDPNRVILAGKLTRSFDPDQP